MGHGKILILNPQKLSMVYIIFVRHGQSTSNVMRVLSHDRDKHPLTDLGKTQAEKAGIELSRVSVSKLFTSPVLRARETAEIIGKRIGLRPLEDPRLTERYLGEFNNTKVPEGAHWKIQLYSGNFRGVERWEEMQERMLSFMDSVRQEEVVVAVSHHDPIKSVIGYILGLDDILTLGITIMNSFFTVVSQESDLRLLSIGSPVLPRQVPRRS